MDTKTVIELVDELQENLEDLEDSLDSVFKSSLASLSKKLPLLDRAKLNVLLVYSIESLLFSYLKLHGVQAKEHPVFKELTRVRQYFEKIKSAAATPKDTQPATVLNKDAAGRFIKHALAGNTKYDLERAEREAREKILANKRLKALEATMKERAMKPSNENEEPKVVAALVQAAQLVSVPQDNWRETAPLIQSDSGSESGEVTDRSPIPRSQQEQKRDSPYQSTPNAKRKRGDSSPAHDSAEEAQNATPAKGHKKGKKKGKKSKANRPKAG